MICANFVNLTLAGPELVPIEAYLQTVISQKLSVSKKTVRITLEIARNLGEIKLVLDAVPTKTIMLNILILFTKKCSSIVRKGLTFFLNFISV